MPQWKMEVGLMAGIYTLKVSMRTGGVDQYTEYRATSLEELQEYVGSIEETIEDMEKGSGPKKK